MINFNNDDPRRRAERCESEAIDASAAKGTPEDDEFFVIGHHRHLAREADRIAGIIACAYIVREEVKGRFVGLTPSQARDAASVLGEISDWLEESAKGMARVVQHLELNLPRRPEDR